MVIAVLEMTLPRGNEAVTIGALRAFWDATCARPGCVGGGLFQEVGQPGTALYIEMWQDPAQLEAHIRSPGYPADRAHGHLGRSPSAPLQLRERDARPRVGGAAAARVGRRRR